MFSRLLNVDEALETKVRENEDGKIHTPLQVFGCLIERVREGEETHRKIIRSERAIVNDEEEARRVTVRVDAARELGGSVEQLGKAFERLWKTSVEVDDLSYSYFVSC